MPKIYLICLDAYPEIPGLISLMKKRNLSRSELVCSGAFTCATMISIISGKLGTEVLTGGIGYNTVYDPRFFSWRKDQSIVDRVLEKGMDVRVHNHVPWFSGVIGGKPISKEDQNKHYREHSASVKGAQVFPFGLITTERSSASLPIYSSTHPDLTLNTFMKWNFPSEKDKFYANEKDYIHWLQQQKFQGLFLTDLCHWHEAVYYPLGQIHNGQSILKEEALKDSLEWLSNWNFDEPDSLFLIFADHSHRVQGYLDPQSYLTWLYYKDNTSKDEFHPILSSNDLYPLIEKRLGLDRTKESSIWTRYPVGNYDPKRIYAIEDSRANSVVKTQANVFARTRFDGDKILSVVRVTDPTNYPIGIYIFLSSLQNKYTYTVYRFNTLETAPEEVFTIRMEGALSVSKKSFDRLYELNSELLKETVSLF